MLPKFKILKFGFHLLFVIWILILLPTSVLAQQSATTSTLPAYIPPTSPLYTDLFVQNMFHSFSCLSVGTSTIGVPCLSYKSGLPVLSKVDTSGGLLGTTGHLIEALYTNPPIKSVDYLAMLGKDLGLVREAHAQVIGSGGGVLSPVVKLWQVSRNVAYLAMIIIFVIIGLMVMFRQRINPQTVITAQAALPGLVIGLIMITFSYFLAALISDTAFIGTNLVGYYFSAVQGNGNNPQDLLKDTSNQNILTMFGQLTGVVGQGDITRALEIAYSAMSEEVQRFLSLAAGLIAFQYGNQIGHVVPIIGDIAGIIVGTGVALAIGSQTPQVLGVVLHYIAIAILIYSMLKLLLRLVNSYLTIIFLTLTAPFHFLVASLPGRQGIATNWILNMLANVLVFPAVLAVFYFIAYISGINQTPFSISSSAGLFDTNKSFPGFGGMDTNFINIILAFGTLVALPSIPDIVVRTVGRVGQAGQLIGQELSGNMRGGQGYYTQAQTAGRQAASKISQDYEHFRGVDPGYSPSVASGLAQPTGFLGGLRSRLLGKKKNPLS